MVLRVVILDIATSVCSDPRKFTAINSSLGILQAIRGSWLSNFRANVVKVLRHLTKCVRRLQCCVPIGLGSWADTAQHTSWLAACLKGQRKLWRHATKRYIFPRCVRNQPYSVDQRPHPKFLSCLVKTISSLRNVPSVPPGRKPKLVFFLVK